jgi:hypothetical protein
LFVIKRKPISSDPNDPALLLISGRAPANFRIEGLLRLPPSKKVVLPDGLVADTLDVNGAPVHFGKNISVRRLILKGAQGLKELPSSLRCGYLELQGTEIRALPSDLDVEYKIDLTDCAQLESLPSGLKTGALVLRNCVKLRQLPEDMQVNFLDISGCTQIRELPKSGCVRHGRLLARGCVNLEHLPDWLKELAELDLRNCPKICELPSHLRVSAWVDVAGTAVKSLPKSMSGVGLRWRGVTVNEKVVFRPETISASEVLTERNAEVRRVMLERIGFERFLKLADAKVLHQDTDHGGERRLLKVEIPNDEALVCVSFLCPSTNRQYVVRVPPTMTSCHAAVAWMAGFDNPDDYHPVVET